MTNTEARQILIDYNAWRRGDSDDMPCPKTLGLAIDAAIVALGKESEAALADLAKTSQEMGLYHHNDDLTIAYLDGYANGKRSKSSIAQAIRDAAVNLTDDFFKNLSVVEFGIIDAFWDGDMSPFSHWSSQCYLQKSSGRQHHARTFMLLVAEALES
jgi:hypothetical protein